MYTTFENDQGLKYIIINYFMNFNPFLPKETSLTSVVWTYNNFGIDFQIDDKSKKKLKGVSDQYFLFLLKIFSDFFC